MNFARFKIDACLNKVDWHVAILHISGSDRFDTKLVLRRDRKFSHGSERRIVGKSLEFCALIGDGHKVQTTARDRDDCHRERSARNSHVAIAIGNYPSKLSHSVPLRDFGQLSPSWH